MRPSTSWAGWSSAPSKERVLAPCRLCTASMVGTKCRRKPSTTWKATVARARCASATALARSRADWPRGDVQYVYILGGRVANARRPGGGGALHFREDAYLRQPPGTVRRGDGTVGRGAGQLPAGVHAHGID